MSPASLPSTAFMYVETDVPAGMTLDAWRRRAAEAPQGAERPRRRRRVVWIGRVELHNPLQSVLPVPRSA